MISVITPVYNGEQFIESCIQVVIEQQCPDVEHIIVDGGSKDGTVDIIKRYAEQYSHIRWLSEKDQGQSDAMNKGIAMAKGEILAILNVDDYYEPNVLNRIATIFETLPQPSLLIGNCNIWGSESNLLYINKPSRTSLYSLIFGLYSIPENPSAYFYHKSLHQQTGLYNIDEHYSMDLDFLIRATQVAQVNYVDELWGNFRRFEGTKTFEALQDNQCALNNERVLKNYHRKLPLFQRWYATITYEFYKALGPKLKYVFADPKNIYEVIGNKLSKSKSRRNRLVKESK